MYGNNISDFGAPVPGLRPGTFSRWGNWIETRGPILWPASKWPQ
jgi:hypothetical protein